MVKGHASTFMNVDEFERRFPVIGEGLRSVVRFARVVAGLRHPVHGRGAVVRAAAGLRFGDIGAFYVPLVARHSFGLCQ